MFKSHVLLYSIFSLMMVGAVSSCSKKEEIDEIEKEVVDVNLKGIELKKQPDQLVYFIGQPLNLAGIEVYGVYGDNTKKQIKISNENISGFSSDTPTDNMTVEITVKSFKATFKVEVLPLKVTEGVLTGVVGNISELKLPDGIKSIGKAAFRNSKVTKVTLNEGLTHIGEEAFAWSKITEIHFPASLTTIDPFAFYDCENLKSVDLSHTAIKVIVGESFSYNTSIAELKLPNGLSEIGPQAFIQSTGLKELKLPEGLLKIGNEAFRETGLVKLTLPNSVGFMDQRAFYYAENLETVETYGANPSTDIEQRIMNSSTFEGCNNLKSFAIPQGVRIIGQNTLSKAPFLSTMILPATVEQINFNAFGISSLKSVIIEGETPAKAATISGAWYGFPDKIEEIKVPQQSIEAYKAAPGWKEFARVITKI
ncbi:MAG: leucine-rich repeat protein [Bacteroidales bacterium]